jgi:hypothetical protein
LHVRGIAAPSTPFDQDNCEALCGRLEELLVRSVRELSVSDYNGGGATEIVAKIYFCNNTLLDISDRCKIYAEEERKKHDEEVQRRIGELNKAANALASELSSLALSADGSFFLTGDEKVASSYADAISLPLGYTTVKVNGREMDIPAVWNLADCGTVFIQVEENSLEDSGIEALIENTILKFLFAYPAASKRVTVCDRCCSAELISFVTRLAGAKGCARLFSDSSENDGCLVQTTADGAVRELSKLQINTRIAATGGKIFAYNRANGENAQTPVLVVLRGFGGSMNYAKAELFNSLLLNGSKAGIFFLVIDTVIDTVKDTVNGAGSSIIPKNAHAVRYNYDKRLCAITDAASGDSFFTDLRRTGFTLDGCIRKLTEAVSVSTSVIPFSSLPRDRSKKNFPQMISVAIGKEAERVVTLDLSAKSSMAHCVITGMTGSGKSSLLHDMILGIAETYSPSEVEFWLLDFKTGAEFTPYVALKHVKKMALNNKSRDASDLMSDILNQMRRRQGIITGEGASNIVQYNEKMRKEGCPEMTRILIVIDEYTEMKSLKCIADFETVALQGRSAGISFIISSLIHDGMFKRITDQASHKFEFRNKTLGVLIPSCSEAERTFLSSLDGNCIYHDGNVIHRMRAAYVGDVDAVIRKIEEINEHYKAHKYEKPIIMGEATEIGAKELHGNKNEARSLYRRERRISTGIGKSRDGEEISFIMGRERTQVLLLGDEARCASVELSLATEVSLLDDSDNVYYLDLYKSADRLPNVIADSEKREFRYAKSNKDIGRCIKELYSEFLKREESLDNDEPIGGPILLMLHGAEYLQERAANITRLLESGATSETAKHQDTASLSLDDMDDLAESILNRLGSFAADPPKSDGEKDALKMLSKLVSVGSRVRIYATVHYENVKGLRSMTEQLFDGRKTVNDFIIVPPRITGQHTVSAKYVTEYLAAAGVNTSDFDKDGEISSSELLYGYLVSGTTSTRFVPYEETL